MKHRELRILCVDDSLQNLKLLERVLQKSGYQLIDTCTSAHEALELQEKAPYDLIITDHQMDGMTGMDLIREIKRLYYLKTEIMMITAYGGIESSVDAMKAGAMDYITKPIQPDILLKKIEHFQLKLEKEEDYEEQEYGLLKVQEDAEHNMAELQMMVVKYQVFAEELQQVLKQSEALSKQELTDLIQLKMKELSS
jgi:DNA-binding response OmpR family regulator